VADTFPNVPDKWGSAEVQDLQSLQAAKICTVLLPVNMSHIGAGETQEVAMSKEKLPADACINGLTHCYSTANLAMPYPRTPDYVNTVGNAGFAVGVSHSSRASENVREQLTT
jgi:hypothetical protein